jgi:aminodeoxyfutalosine synthase
LGNQRQEQTVDNIRRLIVEAGYIPVERDTLYRRIERDASGWRVAGTAATDAAQSV